MAPFLWYFQIEFLKPLIVWISLFFSRRKVHASIHLLLSFRHGVSPGAKELGEVMWPSPPLSFSALRLRYRDLSLTVGSSSFTFFFISRCVLRRRHRLHPYIFADFIQMEGLSVQGSSRR
jgi:hypothetical protein